MKLLLTIAASLMVSAAARGHVVAPPPAGETKLRLATLAPKDSSVHRVLQELAETWKQAPDGGIKLVIHADASMGGEGDVVKKMRVGQIHAALLTVAGLREIDVSVTALQNLPLVFRTLDEATFVRERLAPRIAESMRKQGFELLFLGDLGWVRYFSVRPLLHPHELKQFKLFTWTGDNAQVDLMKELGLDPVPLEPTDILIGLQTGLVDAVPMVPFFAQIAQLHDKAKYMLDLEWAPLVGGGVMTSKAWNALTEGQRKLVLESARRAGDEIIRRNREEAAQSIEAMKKRGLTVTPVSDEVREEWRAFLAPVYPKLRGKLVPAELFDEVMSALAERRQGGANPPR